MNSLNRDMNQQNKTERWEEKQVNTHEVMPKENTCISEHTNNWEAKKYFEANLLDGEKVGDCGGAMIRADICWEIISQLLSDARREEREAIALKSLLIFPNLKSDFPSEQKKFSREFIHKRIEEAWLQFDSALTTAEERIKSLSLPDQEQLTSKENQDE